MRLFVSFFFGALLIFGVSAAQEQAAGEQERKECEAANESADCSEADIPDFVAADRASRKAVEESDRFLEESEEIVRRLNESGRLEEMSGTIDDEAMISEALSLSEFAHDAYTDGGIDGLFEMDIAGLREARQQPPREARAGNDVEARYFVFLSFSMGESAIQRVVDLNRDRDDVLLIFQGFPEEMGLVGFGQELFRLAYGETIPKAPVRRLPLAIHPQPFLDHGVDRAPAILDRDTGEIAFGHYSSSVFPVGEFPLPGVATKPVIEENLIKKLMLAASQYEDPLSGRERVDRYVEGLEFFATEPAVIDVVRYVDPRVIVPEDVPDGQGGFLARRGDVFHPFDHLPFDMSIFVIDARRVEQVAWLKSVLYGVRKPVILLSGFDRDEGLATFQRLSEELEHSVFLLTKEVAERFDVRRSPTLVSAEGEFYRIEEFAIDQKVAQGDGR